MFIKFYAVSIFKGQGIAIKSNHLSFRHPNFRRHCYIIRIITSIIIGQLIGNRLLCLQELKHFIRYTI